jgi:hypothetical protein
MRVHVGVGDLASSIETANIIKINPNETWEEYMF